jgi:lipopolysaccharide assembly outer membrane protein LptD (OstA)
VVFQRGYYLTDEQKGEFFGQVALFDQGKTVVCDTLYFNKISQVGMAHGNVYIQDSIDQWKVWGKHAQYNGLAKSIKVWNQALAYQGDAKKPFKLKADTLAYNSDSTQPVALTATYNVAFSQETTSGKCNKLTSKRSDSTFYFSGKPVLYDSVSRVSGDSIEMRVVAQKVKELKSFKHGFVAIQEDSIHFSQIQGDSIHQWMDANQKMEKVRVVGNAQSIYFLRNADTLESANTVTCKSMKIGFQKGKIDQITFYEKPVGTLYPIDQLPAVDSKLKGFVWDMQNKPAEKLFLPPHTVSIPELPYPKGEKSKKKNKKTK